MNPVYLIIDKIIEYIKEINGNKYLTPVCTVESKDKLKSMKNYGTKLEILGQ